VPAATQAANHRNIILETARRPRWSTSAACSSG
jgi:hypothetical protein